MNEILNEDSIYLYKSDNGKKRKCVEIECPECGICFWVDKRTYTRANEDLYCTSVCKQKHKGQRVSVKCHYCDEIFFRSKSKLKNSKSGLYFCCREHKDLAQRIENNNEALWLSHYNNGKSNYRDNALRHYGNKCECCGYDTLNICEVHHIDKDRTNNELDNLIVLCPNCHMSIHKGCMFIENRVLKENENNS